MLASALQLHETVSLPLRRALLERQAAGDGEDLAGQIARTRVDACLVVAANREEALVTQIGPGGDRRKEVVDSLCHLVLATQCPQAALGKHAGPSGSKLLYRIWN